MLSLINAPLRNFVEIKHVTGMTIPSLELCRDINKYLRDNHFKRKEKKLWIQLFYSISIMIAMREYFHLLVPPSKSISSKDKTSVSKAAFSGKIHQLCRGTVTMWSLGGTGFPCLCVPCTAAAEFISSTEIQVMS